MCTISRVRATHNRPVFGALPAKCALFAISGTAEYLHNNADRMYARVDSPDIGQVEYQTVVSTMMEMLERDGSIEDIYLALKHLEEDLTGEEPSIEICWRAARAMKALSKE